MPSLRKSQWACFLENLGEWHGSFTQLSPQGVVLSDVPSTLTLAALDEQCQTVRLTLHRQGAGELVLEFTSVGGSLQFFVSGTFSQGALQFSPVGTFGAELAFKAGDRRLRLVQLFQNRRFEQLTLIREHLVSSTTPERPPLQVADLLGEWQGEAVTLYADGRATHIDKTQLSLAREGDRLTQQLTFGDRTLASSATISGTVLTFDQGKIPIQVLLLPDGASCTCPLTIPSGQSFFLEAGWLMQPDLRQRLIRSYNSQGEWVSLTLVTERKLSDR